MTEDQIMELNAFIEEAQHYYATSWPKREVPSAREVLQCLGFDNAKAKGWLEPYKDALGENMRRDSDAFENNWGDRIKNSKAFE